MRRKISTVTGDIDNLMNTGEIFFMQDTRLEALTTDFTLADYHN